MSATEARGDQRSAIVKKSAIITGAARGIGAAIARDLAQAGSRVRLLDPDA